MQTRHGVDRGEARSKVKLKHDLTLSKRKTLSFFFCFFLHIRVHTENLPNVDSVDKLILSS